MTDERAAEAGLDVTLARALSHPLRQQLLMAYNQQVASPSELAVKLGRPTNEVAYHTKRLLELGCIRLVRTERGPGVKHFYEAVARTEFDDASWSRLPAGMQRKLAVDTIAQVIAEARAADAAGTLSGDDAHVSRVPLELDEAAWQELSSLLVDVVERAQELSRQSGARRRSGGTLRASVLSILHFERA